MEFKQEVVRLMEESDRPAAEIAMELGVRRNQLYKWNEQLQGIPGTVYLFSSDRLTNNMNRTRMCKNGQDASGICQIIHCMSNN